MNMRGNAPQVDENIQPIPVDKLVLDSSNPRLIGYPHIDREIEIMRHLVDKADLEELVDSIATNGYLDIEPLIVISRGTKAGDYLVIEGNRRVAAIKLLKNPALSLEVGIPIPTVSSEVKKTLLNVKAMLVPDREEARRFIGFKHINGPHKWDSFAKARFAADWYASEREKGLSIREIARSLGDRHDTIRRLVQGIFVLDQAVEAGLFEIEDRFNQDKPFFFSHLYTAIGRLPYREYLGLAPDWRKDEPQLNPVPPDRVRNLEKFFHYLYGSHEDQIAPVITSQNPHVKQLGEVLANESARLRLEQTNKLAEAYSEVDTVDRRFEHSLVLALQHAEDASSVLYGLASTRISPSLLDVSRRLAKSARVIFKNLTDFAAGDEDEEIE